MRRHTDIVEAWIVLAVWTVIALGGTLVGLVTAHAADESFAQLRRERHSVPAVLMESTFGAVPTGEGTAPERVRAKVRWTASDGSTRTGRTLVDSGRKAGSKVVIWMNSQGQLAAEPPTAGAAAAEAALFGTGAALAFGGLTFAAGRLAQWRLDQQRYDQWGREWDQAGPQWGRKAA
ncbi:hypothetical protein [Streptomyces sp. MMG1533]|uniref:Rv1733c family protein n=1 Tax=Streptomyces sp. MMG1533 TaxID=1415546 RepID=UPI002D21EB28|nr:hypothetical protein [Streptomyces sp. MMG1533]